MCKIYTFTCDMIDEMLPIVAKDWLGNSDGATMLTDHSCLSTMKRSALLASLDGLGRSPFQRVWIHLRMATGSASTINLNGTHGWTAHNYRVFHNGIMSRPHDHLYVDSQLICEDITNYGVDYAIDSVLDYDYFANVMIVDVTNNDYHIIRSGGGVLFTDQQGNYSTSPTPSINVLVDKDYRADYLGDDEGLTDYDVKGDREEIGDQDADRFGESSLIDDDITALDVYFDDLNRMLEGEDEVEACKDRDEYDLQRYIRMGRLG